MCPPYIPGSAPLTTKQCYWAEVDGNGTNTWNDAALSPVGVEQAETAHGFWQDLIVHQRIHTPDAYFTSPLTRCLQTANLTFEGLQLPRDSASFRPTVKELFREGISIHTCDSRRSKDYIHNLFPRWNIEPGFTMNDELWNGITAESTDAQNMRSKKVLDEVFEELSEQTLFVSVTSHSGEIASILSVLGHRSFGLNTGAVIPVLVRAEKQERDVATTCQPWTVSAHCTAPPATSLANCVCASSAAAVTTPLVTVTYEPATTDGPVCYNV